MILKKLFVDTNELSKLISISPNTLKKWARMDIIPGRNIGGKKWIFNIENVIEALSKK